MQSEEIPYGKTDSLLALLPLKEIWCLVLFLERLLIRHVTGLLVNLLLFARR